MKLCRLLAALLLAAAAAAATPLSAQKKTERKLAVGMEGALRIHNMVGSVVVRGWKKDTVVVRATLAPGEELHMGGSYNGAKMFVESADDRNPKPTSLEVWAPAGIRLWIKTATASIDVRGISGGLDLYVVSGRIDVAGSPRELNAEAIDGDISIAGSPSWLRAKSATGAVTFRGASRDAAITTVSGPVRIEGGSFERTKIETVTGNITFAGQLDRSGAFDFDTHGGTIDIALPPKTHASFTVVSIAGRIQNQLSKARSVSGRFGRGEELSFDAGDGGGRVSVRTFKGPIILRYSK